MERHPLNEITTYLHALFRAVTCGQPAALDRCADFESNWSITICTNGHYVLASGQRVQVNANQHFTTAASGKRPVIDLDKPEVASSFGLGGRIADSQDTVPRPLVEVDKEPMTPLHEPASILELALNVGFMHKQKFAYHEHLAIHLLLVCYLHCKRTGYPSQTLWTWMIHHISDGLEGPAHDALLSLCQRLLSHRCEDLTPSIPQRLHYPSLLHTVGAIRLMVLWPARATHDKIKCQLANESLENSFDFEALSYVWGDSSDRRVIEVDGVDFTITSNLDTALRHLRYHDSKPRVLWVDAVCIDQSNHAERSFQVRQMREIFSKAREVIIWLGPESRTTAQAFNIITRNGKEVDKFLDKDPEPPDHSLPGGVSTLPRDLELTIGHKFPSRRLPYWFRFTVGEVDAIIKLLNRPWFRRIWVIQEIAFAATATVYCGKVKFRWDDLAITTRMMRDNFVNLQTPTERIGEPAEVENGLLASTMFFTVVRRNFCRPHKLEDLLTICGTFEMTDPRDRVYALLSLSADFCSGKTARSVLQLDYSLSFLLAMVQNSG